VVLNQNFGMVSNAYIRIIDQNNGFEITRYDLSEDTSTFTAMIFGELYRYNNDWKFNAVGQGFTTSLVEIARKFVVNI
jgi:tellurium resistance protein TerD